MGWGDEILVSGEARRLHDKDPERRAVAVVDIHGRPRWSPLWSDNPRILHPGQMDGSKPFLRLTNGPRCRPYIDYDRMRLDFAAVFPDKPFDPKKRDPRLPYRFTDHRCTVGDLHCFKRSKPQGYVVVEPHYKIRNVNREWGWGKWQAVVDALDLDWVQINPPRERILTGVRHLPGSNFVEACRLLSGAMAYVGSEGGLYHAAAALGLPAVAIFGGFVSPENQGYDGPRYANLYEPMDGKSPCGQRVRCGHCEEAMARITPEIVARHVERVLDA